MGCIYKVTNTENGKIYIGKTIRPLKVRKQAHLRDAKNPQYYFHKAIYLYGEDAFQWEEIFQSDNEKELFEKEIEYIAIYSSNVSGIGYNLTKGGDGASVGILGSTLIKKLNYEYNGIMLSITKIGETLNMLKSHNIKPEQITVSKGLNYWRFLPMAYEAGMRIKSKMDAVISMGINEKKRYYITGYYDKIVEAAS